MNNKKTTKRALISSLLSLVLCMSMLIGTTFAWFTDQASTSVNTIQSGDLEIALEYSTDDGTTWADAEGQALNFKTADGRTDILWEPGCTYELPLIRVRNNGNLALKYELAINGVTGSAKLLEAIEFSANGAPISSFSGTLLEKDDVSGSILIKGHMKEEAGNEYENLEISGIGITVYATQFTYEKDSYDDQYDAAAGTAFVGGNGTEEDPYLVNDLNGMLALANMSDTYNYYKIADGVETIDALGGSININLCGSFDGNGVIFKNLSGNLFKNVYGEPGQNCAGTAVVKNFDVEFVNSTGGVVHFNKAANFTMEDVNVTGYIENVGNIGSFMDFGGSTNQKEYNVTIKDCHSDATVVSTANPAAGFIGHHYASNDSTYTVIGSSFTGELYSSTNRFYVFCSNWMNYKIMFNGVETDNNSFHYDAAKSHTLTTTQGDMPAKYDVFTANKAANYDHAQVQLIIGPNGNGTTVFGGNYTGVYITETPVDNGDGTLSTEAIKNFDLYCNAAGVAQTGVSADGKAFHIVNSSYNQEIGKADVRLIQYDAAGNIINITSWTLID